METFAPPTVLLRSAHPGLGSGRHGGASWGPDRVAGGICYAALAAFGLCPWSPTMAQPVAPGSRTDEVVELAAVEVTGSIIKRAEVEGAAPVKIISRSEIEESGRASVSDYLLLLPEAGYSSNNENAAALGVNYRGMSVLNLRGFDANNTLVLVDGRRPVLSGIGWNTTMFVDLNRFPTGMVERIEILQDSGTLYGSGSVGGVVNVILRKDYRGAELNVRYDNSLRTDVGRRTFSFIAGSGGTRTSVTVGLNYSAQNSLRAADTSFARSADHTAQFAAKGAAYAARAAAGTFDYRSTVGPHVRVWLDVAQGQVSGRGGVGLIPGFPEGAVINRLPGVAATRATTAATAATPSFLNPFQQGTGGQFNAAAAGTFGPQVLARNVEPSNYYNQNEPLWLTPRTERTGVDLSLRHNLSPYVSLYGRLSYQHNWSFIAGTPETMLQKLPRTNTWNPFGVDVMIQWLPVELGPRTSNSVDETTTALLGVRGTLAGRWQWDTACSYGFDRNTEIYGNYLSKPGWEELGAKSTPEALNVFGGAGYRNPPAVIDRLRLNWDLQGKARAYTWDARLSGDLFALPTGPVGSGLLVETRREEFGDYRRTVNERTNLLNPVFDWSDPPGKRTIGSTAVELHVPLVRSGKHRFLHAADLAVASRYDRYRGFDSGLKPYFGLRVQPARGLTMRASLARTFQAPSLPTLHGRASDLSLPSGDLRRPFLLTGDPRDAFGPGGIFRPEGDTNLQPCHSRTWQSGFVADLPVSWLKGLTVGATYSCLEETGTLWMDMFGGSRFYLLINEVGGGTGDYVVREPGTETYTNTTNAPILILSGPNDARTAVPPGATVTVPGRILYVRLAPMNLSRQRAENWNFSAEYTRGLGGWGEVRLRSYGAYAVYRGSARAGVNLENTIGRDAYPRLRFQSSLAWMRREWSAAITQRYIGPYGDLNRGNGVEVASYTTFGAQMSREFGREAKRGLAGLRFTLGVDNLLDRDPSLAANAVGLDRGNALFPQGRVFYAQLKKRY